MPIVRTGESEYDKELAKWDTPKRQGGMAPDGYEPFPAMLYLARVRPNGKAQCEASAPHRMHFQHDNQYLAALSEADAFTASCQRIVRSPSEKDRAWSEGWRNSPVEAVEHYEALQKAIADAAAEANFTAARMSPKAQAERAKREAATAAHVPE